MIIIIMILVIVGKALTGNRIARIGSGAHYGRRLDALYVHVCVYLYIYIYIYIYIYTAQAISARAT